MVETLRLSSPAPITPPHTSPVVPRCRTATKEAAGWLADKAWGHVTPWN